MRVALSLSPLTNDSKTRGVGVYTRQLVSALQKYFPDSVFTTPTKNCYSKQVDLVHFPFFDPFFLTLPFKKPLPTIVTVHDAIPLKFPSHFPPGLRGLFKFALQKRSLAKAAHVITDSVSSRSDIENLLDVPGEKISVIPLAPTIARSTKTIVQSIVTEYNLPNNYLLYVGDINWNKNLPGLIDAFSLLNRRGLSLLLVGKVFADRPDIPEFRILMQKIDASPVKSRIKLMGYVPTHHMPYIYSHATLYVQPSWYEGFGLPILEAMSQGCPVLSSSMGSLREVGGDAVAYFNPHNSGEFVESLAQLLASSTKRRQLGASGEQRAKDFTWEKTARATFQIYEQVLGK